VVLNDGGQQETRTFILDCPSRHFAMAIAQNLERDTGGALIFRLYQLVNGRPFKLVTKLAASSPEGRRNPRSRRRR
jgi:hypothetical protein